MLFGKKDLAVETNNQKADEKSAFISKYAQSENHRIEKLSEDLAKFPSENEIFFLQTIQSFNAFTFIQKIAKTYFIEELVATTYSVSMSVVEAIMEMQRLGQVDQIRLFVSDSMMSRNPKVTDAIDSWANQNSSVKITYGWNHSKVNLVKTADHHFIIEGSGNWGKNACYEQYIFLNNKDVYEFRRELFSDSKAVRRIM